MMRKKNTTQNMENIADLVLEIAKKGNIGLTTLEDEAIIPLTKKLVAKLEEERAMLIIGKWLNKIPLAKGQLSKKELLEVQANWKEILASLNIRVKEKSINHVQGDSFTFQGSSFTFMSEDNLLPNKITFYEDIDNIQIFTIKDLCQTKIYRYISPKKIKLISYEDENTIRDFLYSWFKIDTSLNRFQVSRKLQKLFRELGFENLKDISFLTFTNDVLQCRIIERGNTYILVFKLADLENLPNLQIYNEQLDGTFEYASSGIRNIKVEYSSPVSGSIKTIQRDLKNKKKEQKISIRSSSFSFDLKYMEDLYRSFTRINTFKGYISRIETSFSFSQIYSAIVDLLPDKNFDFQELTFKDHTIHANINIKKEDSNLINIEIQLGAKNKSSEISLKDKRLTKIDLKNIIKKVSEDAYHFFMESQTSDMVDFLNKTTTQVKEEKKKLAIINQGNEKAIYLKFGKWLQLIPKNAIEIPNMEVASEIKKYYLDFFENHLEMYTNKECQVELLSDENQEIKYIKPDLKFCVTTNKGRVKRYGTYHPEIKCGEIIHKSWLTEEKREIATLSTNTLTVIEYEREGYKFSKTDNDKEIKIEVGYPAYLIDKNNNLYLNQKGILKSLKRTTMDASITDIYQAIKSSFLSEIKCYPKISIRILKNGIVQDELLLEYGIPKIFQATIKGNTYRICSDGTGKYETETTYYEQQDDQLRKVEKNVSTKDREEYKSAQRRIKKLLDFILEEDEN